ncbi:TPA: hypothetical protein G5V04_003875 [Salmonella enterica]|nr:hypothetical protein [Salmonella enterica]
MRKHIAEQVNEFLQGYHFDSEDKPHQKDTNFNVLKNGISSLYNTLFYSGNTEAQKDKQELTRMIKQLADGIVPKPVIIPEGQQ